MTCILAMAVRLHGPASWRGNIIWAEVGVISTMSDSWRNNFWFSVQNEEELEKSKSWEGDETEA
jgi:hypothetical protein